MDNDHENQTTANEEEGSIIYVVGAIIVVAVIVTAVLLWPKAKNQTANTVTPTGEGKVVEKPTLTKLVCENEWYNPMVGVPKFYLSASGGDVSDGKNIQCTFELIKERDTLLTEKLTVPVTENQSRGGTEFQCTTKALDGITQGVPIKMNVTVKNDDGKTASCTGMITFRGQ